MRIGKSSRLGCTAKGYYGDYSLNKAFRYVNKMELDPQFSILDGLRLDSERRYWIEHRDTEGTISDIGVDIGQMSTGVEILLTMSHNILTIAQEHIK